MGSRGRSLPTSDQGRVRLRANPFVRSGARGLKSFSLFGSRPLDLVPTRHHDAVVRTTLNINDALLKELRERARETRRPLRCVLEETIAAGLARSSNPKAAPRYRVRPHALRLKAGFRNASMNQLFDQLEAERNTK